MRRKIVVSLILITTFLSVGMGVAVLLVLTRPTPPTVDTTRPPMLVKAVTVMPKTIVEPIVGYGTVRADRYARLSAEVSGEIVALAEDLRSGAFVKKGQLLARIDERQYQEQLNRAKSQLVSAESVQARLDVEERNLDRVIRIAEKEVEIAQRDYRRVAGLIENDQAANREFDLALQQYERTRRELVQLQNQKALLPKQREQNAAAIQMRKAEVKLAELPLEHCTITAPFDGQLHEVKIEIGERVTIGQVLLSLLDPDLVEIPISVPKQPEVGVACRLFIESEPEAAWTGVVKRISPQASEATRTVDVFVEVDNTKQTHPLAPGRFIRAVIDGPLLENVLAIPRGTIQDQRVFVYAEKEGRAFPRRVHVKKQLLTQTVVEGIEPGQIVITSNLDTLFEGVRVRVDTHDELANGTSATPGAAAQMDPAQSR